MTVLLLSSFGLHFLFGSFPLLLSLSLSFFFGSDVAGLLCLSRQKPVAAVYWSDYHGPSVGAIRDARARIQGPVTCPAGGGGVLQGKMGLQGQGLSGGMKGGRETEEGYKRGPEKGHWGCEGAQQGSIPSFHRGLRAAELGVGKLKGWTWRRDGKLEAPEGDARESE